MIDHVWKWESNMYGETDSAVRIWKEIEYKSWF